MTRFCTQCGEKNTDDAAFCEACGKPFPPKQVPGSAAVQAVTPVSEPAARRVSPALLWGSIGGVVLLIGSLAAVVFFAMPPLADPRDQIAEAIDAHLLAQPQLTENLVCLNNLPYQHAELHVRPLDQATIDWLDILVAAGLYLPPRDAQVERGLQLEEQKVYVRTEAGAQAIRGNRLCFAEGVELVRLEAATPPRELKNGDASSTARFFYRYRNAQGWTKSPQVEDLMPARFAQSEWPAGAQLQRRDKVWSVERLVDVSVAEQALRREAASAAKPAPTGGLQSWFKGLFASKAVANPLLGSWRADLGGLGNLAGMAGVLGVPGGGGQEQLLLTLEFDADQMRLMGQEIAVSYEVRAGEILVRAEKSGSNMPGGSDILSFKLQDPDHISLDLALIEIPYTRVR